MSRIPLALQAVFLASNRGQEVHKPPPGRLGDRVFAFQPTAARTWFWQKRNVNKHANSTPPETSTPPRGRSHRWSTSKKEKRHNAAAAAQLPTTPTTMKCNLETASQSSSPVMDIYVPATDSSIQLGGGSPKKATKKGSSRLRKSSSRPVVERADSTTSSVTFHTTLVQKKNVQSTLTPQDFLEMMLRERGYSTERFKVLESGYYNKTTKLQRASYDVYIVGLVKSGNAKKLGSVLSSGIAPNPANTFGESILHMVCRNGSFEMLRVMMDSGCDIQVADDNGRTPLHDACWASEPALDVVQALLNQDPRMLFLTDARGAVPLSYVQHQHFSIWLDFLSANKDVLWPRRPSRHEQDPPPLALIKPQSRPARNPEKVLSMDLVRMVASGRMSPEEIAMLNDSDDEEDDDDDDDEDYEVNDFDDERFQESCRSDQSFSGRVSFGGNTFNFSDSESDDEKNVGDDDDDQTEQQPQLGDDALLTDNVVAAIITQTIEVSSDNYCASKNPIVHDMESNQSSWLFSKKDAFVPQFYSYSAAKSKSSKNRLIHSPFAAAATTTKTNARVNDDDNDENPIVGFGKLKLRKQKNKRPSPRGSHLSQENSHGSDSASLHSEISFKSYSRGEGIPSSSRSTYPSTESSYQDSFRSRRNSHVSLSTFHSSEGLNNSRRDLFCLMEDDDGLLAGSC